MKTTFDPIFLEHLNIFGLRLDQIHGYTAKHKSDKMGRHCSMAHFKRHYIANPVQRPFALVAVIINCDDVFFRPNPKFPGIYCSNGAKTYNY
jgi:hypothetical protein